MTTRTRAGAVRVFPVTLPLADLAAAVVRLATQLAVPVSPFLHDLLATTGNFFAAHYAGILAPVVIRILTAAALAFPLTATAFAAFYVRLWSSRISPQLMSTTADSAACGYHRHSASWQPTVIGLCHHPCRVAHLWDNPTTSVEGLVGHDNQEWPPRVA